MAAAVASGYGAARGLEMALSFARDDFWDPEPLHRAVTRLGLVRGERMERILETHLPRSRIEDCPMPLVVSAVSVPLLAPRLLTEGPLARAVRASCAVPFVIQPVRLGGELLWDGGVKIDAPLRALVQRAPLRAAILHFASWSEPTVPPRLRREIAFAERAGVRVHLARTRYPRIDPDRLDRAPEAVAAGAESARRLIARFSRAGGTAGDTPPLIRAVLPA